MINHFFFVTFFADPYCGLLIVKLEDYVPYVWIVVGDGDDGGYSNRVAKKASKRRYPLRHFLSVLSAF